MEQTFDKIAQEQRAENKRKWLESKKEGEKQPDFPPRADAVRKSVDQLASAMRLTLRPAPGRVTR